MNNKIIIGVCGRIGSGKDTVADYLVNTHGFKRMSFAGSLKDSVSVIFGWDRELLEGRTRQSREWREKPDTWWAERLDIPNLTPRWILQHWGTEVCRQGFHNEIWIHSLEHKLENTTDNVVISDVRFPNEIDSIRRVGGLVVKTTRGSDPDWWADAVTVNRGPTHNLGWATAVERLKKYNVHSSETAWAGTLFDAELNNNGSIDELYLQIKNLLQSPRLSK
jgi:hypothetical protein